MDTNNISNEASSHSQASPNPEWEILVEPSAQILPLPQRKRSGKSERIIWLLLGPEIQKRGNYSWSVKEEFLLVFAVTLLRGFLRCQWISPNVTELFRCTFTEIKSVYFSTSFDWNVFFTSDLFQLFIATDYWAKVRISRHHLQRVWVQWRHPDVLDLDQSLIIHINRLSYFWSNVNQPWNNNSKNQIKILKSVYRIICVCELYHIKKLLLFLIQMNN